MIMHRIRAQNADFCPKLYMICTNDVLRAHNIYSFRWNRWYLSIRTHFTAKFSRISPRPSIVQRTKIEIIRLKTFQAFRRISSLCLHSPYRQIEMWIVRFRTEFSAEWCRLSNITRPYRIVSLVPAFFQQCLWNDKQSTNALKDNELTSV